ncbi:MAG: two pore domain potassium channel family protein [Candidatus Omnitrophica bacterium]|nr:two pore domain potassium channel family protein [Candidatus Omnitrophota bacterium]
MTDNIKRIEQEAQLSLEKKDYEKALKLFSEAGGSYQDIGQHQQAAVCFASAAGCYEAKAGAQSLFYYASSYYSKAAKEAEISGDFEYASMLYKHAGICYERDLEFVGFSECFFLSKECYRKSLVSNLFNKKNFSNNISILLRIDYKDVIKSIILWLSLFFSSLLWGHGERPMRTVGFGCFLVFLFALIYTQGQFIAGQDIHKPHLLESLYFSLVTIMHIGYWDIKPIGLNHGAAILEAFAGVFILPLFLTALCRKYLRF